MVEETTVGRAGIEMFTVSISRYHFFDALLLDIVPWKDSLSFALRSFVKRHRRLLPFPIRS